MICLIIASLCFTAISAEKGKVSDYAGQVAITTNYYTNFFSGALINSQWILTVAMPFPYDENFTVYLGLHNGKFDQVISGNKYIVHPNFSYKNQTNNIALLKLQKPVCENEFVKPLRIMSKIEPKNLFLNLTGWDYTIENSPTDPPRKFRTELVYTLKNKLCQKYKKDLVINSKVFCTTPNAGDKYSCSDKPGSPLINLRDNNEPVLFGISSVTSVCHPSYNGDKIAVALTLSKYKNWILKNTKLTDIFI